LLVGFVIGRRQKKATLYIKNMSFLLWMNYQLITMSLIVWKLKINGIFPKKKGNFF